MSSEKSNWARRWIALAAGTFVAGIVSSASAAVCTFPFPSFGDECDDGTVRAFASHINFVDPNDGALIFSIQVNLLAGELGAIAFGIDENGDLNDLGTTVADEDPSEGQVGIDAQRLFQIPGFVPPQIFYRHADNVIATEVIVF
jgi:hypothetical protein